MTEQNQNTRGSLTPNWEVPKLSAVQSFDKVQERVTTLYDLKIEPDKTSPRARGIDSDADVGYDVVDLRSLVFSSAGQVSVPGQGILEMTPWARQQLGSEMGVKWDKFFEHQSPNEIQQAVTNHLNSRPEGQGSLKKVISRKHETPKASSVGLLRGFVSPSYAEIPDALLFDRMRNVLADRLDEMGFYHANMTDRGSFWSLVFKEPVNMLGDAGNDENAYYGVRIRNSEVGAYSLIADGYLFRLICTNGMITGISRERWLHRRHRHIDNDQIDVLIDNMFEQMMSSRDTVVHRNQRLLETPVENPAIEIRDFMKRAKRPKIEQDAAIIGYVRDLGIELPEDETDLPPTNAYAVTQGIARLGMAARANTERSHDIEYLVGQYILSVLGAAA